MFMDEKADTIKDFSLLGIKTELILKLNSFGISEPSLIQQKTIPAVLENSNVIFESETGTGKTFAYLLPLVQKLEAENNAENKMIILAPTYELASQIKSTAQRITELKSALLIGGTPIKRQIELLIDKPRIKYLIIVTYWII